MFDLFGYSDAHRQRNSFNPFNRWLPGWGHTDMGGRPAGGGFVQPEVGPELEIVREKTDKQAAGQSRSASFTENLANALRQPVIKTDSDIGRSIIALLPVGMTRIIRVEKCADGKCSVRNKRCA